MAAHRAPAGEDEPTQAPMLEGVAVRVGGRMVAWFTDADAAGAWATEHHFGQWFANSCSLPDTPPFTAGQLTAARLDGEALLIKIRPGCVADA